MEDPFLNFQYNIENTNKVSESLSIVRFEKKWVDEIINQQNFDFKLLGDNVPHQRRKISRLPEYFNTNNINVEKKKQFKTWSNVLVQCDYL